MIKSKIWQNISELSIAYDVNDLKKGLVVEEEEEYPTQNVLTGLLQLGSNRYNEMPNFCKFAKK